MSSSSSNTTHKKSRKDREKEWKDDGLKKIGGVNFDAISDRQVGDKRHERERAQKLEIQQKGVAVLRENQPAVSSTFDAFKRMAAGLDGRTLADKMADPNRPTWEQYKKDNEDKLNMVGQDVKKMAEYRKQLDRERDLKLSQGSNHRKKDSSIDSDDGDNDDDNDSERDENKKKSKKDSKRKHNKKEKKSKHKV